MICPNCGSENQDGNRFCSSCGSPLEIVSGDDAQANLPQKAESSGTKEETVQPNNLIMSIIGLVLACSNFAPAGIVISVIAKKNAIKNANGAQPTGKNKIGNMLSTIGIPVGIVKTVLLVVAAIAGLVTWIFTAVNLFNSLVNMVVLFTANFISRKVNETSIW